MRQKRFLKEILQDVLALCFEAGEIELGEEIQGYIQDKPIFATSECMPVLEHCGTKLWASRKVMAYSATMRRWFDGSFQYNLETKTLKFAAMQIYEGSVIHDFTHWVEQLPRPASNVKITGDENYETNYTLKEKDTLAA